MHGSVVPAAKSIEEDEDDDDMDHAGSLPSVNTELIVVGFEVSGTQGRHHTYVMATGQARHIPITLINGSAFLTWVMGSSADFYFTFFLMKIADTSHLLTCRFNSHRRLCW
jgi:hypothetical protein